MTENWYRWHYYAGTSPDGQEGANPAVDDLVEIECENMMTTYTEVRFETRTLPWNAAPPHGLPPHLEIRRWRHCDADTAREWLEWQDTLYEHWSKFEPQLRELVRRSAEARGLTMTPLDGRYVLHGNGAETAVGPLNEAVLQVLLRRGWPGSKQELRRLIGSGSESSSNL